MGDQVGKVTSCLPCLILLFGPCRASSRPGRVLYTPTCRAAVKDARERARSDHQAAAEELGVRLANQERSWQQRRTAVRGKVESLVGLAAADPGPMASA